jgi:WS/DGAT/MGAT family acyltransferase
MRQLGGIDSMFVGAETPSMHLHVVGVMTLDVREMRGGDPRARIRDLVSERIPLLVPFRWRLVESPIGIGAPHWIEDPDFDLDRHVLFTTLRSPGSVADLDRYVANVASTPLNRDRPLWEMHLVDGLADGQVAVVTKLHHSFMDGGAGAEVMASLFDLEPESDTPPPVDTWKPEPVPSTWDLLTEVPTNALTRALRFPETALRTVTGMGGLVGAMFPTADRDPRSYLAPRTPYNGTITPRRAVSLTDCSLGDVKRVKSAFGVTVNDVVLAAVASALRADLDRRGALEALEGRPLIAAVPISVRPADLARDFGNHTSAMMVPLPTHLDDPVERLRAIHELAGSTKQHHRAMGSDLFEEWAGLFPPWLVSTFSRTSGRLGLDRLTPPLFNVIVSNVQGSPIPLYLAGAEVTGIYPLGPLMSGNGLNITVISHCDRLHVGIIAEPTLVEHPDVLAAGIVAGIDELADRIPRPRSATTARRKRTGAGVGDRQGPEVRAVG